MLLARVLRMPGGEAPAELEEQVIQLLVDVSEGFERAAERSWRFRIDEYVP
jgi:hypothetical protein